MARTGIRLALVAAVSVALAWSLAGKLRPLTGLLPMTRSMAATTGAILAETRVLRVEVDRVQASMQQLQHQDELLAEQEELTGEVLAELRAQEALNRQSRRLLVDILAAERATADLTRSVAGAGARAMSDVVDNGQGLNQLAAVTERTAASAQAMDRQMDRLLQEMRGSADNFARLGRLKAATSQAAERTTSWWRRLWERIKR